MKEDIIIDSSVALKWIFPQEPYSDEAVLIQQDFSHKAVCIAVPVLFFYEVGNVLQSGVRMGRIPQSIAEKFYQEINNVEFIAYSSNDIFLQAFQTAGEYNLTVYDASYVVLANYLKIPFFTAEEKLLAKVKGKYVRHIKEYVPLIDKKEERGVL